MKIKDRVKKLVADDFFLMITMFYIVLMIEQFIRIYTNFTEFGTFDWSALGHAAVLNLSILTLGIFKKLIGSGYEKQLESQRLVIAEKSEGENSLKKAYMRMREIAYSNAPDEEKIEIREMTEWLLEKNVEVWNIANNGLTK